MYNDNVLATCSHVYVHAICVHVHAHIHVQFEVVNDKIDLIRILVL